MTFGPEFSRALRDVCSDLAPHVQGGDVPRKVLTIFAYESGLDPARVNSMGFSGLWQRAPTRTKDGGRQLYIAGTGKLNPATQVRDYGAFTLANIQATFRVRHAGAQHEWRVSSPLTTAQLYCINLAPARASQRVVYAHPLAPFPKTRAHVEVGAAELAEVALCQELWPTAYAAQHAKLDPERKGWIRMGDLEAPLLEAAHVLRRRIDAEMAALLAVAAT